MNTSSLGKIGKTILTAVSGLSLRAKLIIVFAALAVIPLVLANLVTSRTAEQAIMKSVFEKNLNLAENIAAEVNQALVEKMRALKIAAGTAEIKSMDPRRQVPLLKDLTIQYPDLLIAIAITPNGDLLVRSDAVRSKINYSDRDYFKAAMRTGATTISDVLVSKTTGKLGFAIAEPIKKEDRTIRGMLIVTVDLQKVIDRIAETKIGNTGYAFIVSKEGKVLMHPDRRMVEQSSDLSQLAPVKAAISGKKGWEEYEFQGQKKLAGYSYLPITGWGLIAQQPLDEAMAGVASVRKTNIIIMLCTVLFAFLIELTLAGVLYKPLALLTSAARKVAQGDLTAQAGFASKDEIGALSAAFDDMTTQLRMREEALRESQEKYRRIVDTATEGMWIVDENRRTSFVNPRMAEMLGYQAGEMIGREIETFLFDEDLRDFITKMENRRQGAAEKYERRWRHKDGHAVWTITSATPIFLDAEQRFTGSFSMLTDITERKRAEHALMDSERKLKAVVYGSPIPQFVIDQNHIVIFWNSALEEITGIKAEDVIGTKQSWKPFYSAPRPCMADLLVDGALENIAELYHGKYRKSKLVADAYEATDFFPALGKDGKWLYFTAVAIKDLQGQVIGAVETLEDITERKQAEAGRQQAFERLRIALDATVHAIATIVEARDPYTAGHQRRVANLACAIANEMGLPSDRVDGIRMASMIHDIGKIAVPSEMLCKPTKLSDKEFSLIKDHAQAGYDILKDINFPWPIARMVIEHHERVDGLGYPHGLTGDKTLLDSHIMTVADFVEAVASHRPYRPALGIDEALDEIQKNRGKAFDPDVVDACIRLFKDRGFTLQNT